MPVCITCISFLLSCLISYTYKLPSLYIYLSCFPHGSVSLYLCYSACSAGISYNIYTIIIRPICLGTNYTTFRLLSRIAFILLQSMIIITCLSIINIFYISCHKSQCHSVISSGPLPRSLLYVCMSTISVSQSSCKYWSYFLTFCCFYWFYAES